MVIPVFRVAASKNLNEMGILGASKNLNEILRQPKLRLSLIKLIGIPAKR